MGVDARYRGHQPQQQQPPQRALHAPLLNIMINVTTVRGVDAVSDTFMVCVESHDLCLLEWLYLSEAWSPCTGEHLFKRTRDARSAGARGRARSKKGTPVRTVPQPPLARTRFTHGTTGWSSEPQALSSRVQVRDMRPSRDRRRRAAASRYLTLERLLDLARAVQHAGRREALRVVRYE